MVTRQAEGLQSFISASMKIEARRVVNVGESIPRVHGPTWDTWPHLLALKTSNDSVELWVHVSVWAPPSTICKYNKFPTSVHPFHHISWLFTCICLFHGTTSQKVGCGRMHLAWLQPAAGVWKRVEDGQMLRAEPLFFSPPPSRKCQGNCTLSWTWKIGFCSLSGYSVSPIHKEGNPIQKNPRAWKLPLDLGRYNYEAVLIMNCLEGINFCAGWWGWSSGQCTAF